MKARERVERLIEIWQKVYPDAHTELNFKNPLELLIATILSAQCTDRRVNMVTPALFKKYRTAKDYANASQAELENAIKSTGFFRNKAKSIRAATSRIAEKFRGKVPSTMEELRELPGVGRKTANVVLGNAFGKNEGIVVDTHVTRLSQRLGLTKHKDALFELRSLQIVSERQSLFADGRRAKNLKRPVGNGSGGLLRCCVAGVRSVMFGFFAEPLELIFKFSEFFFGEVFEVDEFIAGTFESANELIQF